MFTKIRNSKDLNGLKLYWKKVAETLPWAIEL